MSSDENRDPRRLLLGVGQHENTALQSGSSDSRLRPSSTRRAATHAIARQPARGANRVRASPVSEAAAAPRPITSPIATIHPPSISKAS